MVNTFTHLYTAIHLCEVIKHRQQGVFFCKITVINFVKQMARTKRTEEKKPGGDVNEPPPASASTSGISATTGKGKQPKKKPVQGASGKGRKISQLSPTKR